MAIVLGYEAVGTSQPRTVASPECPTWVEPGHWRGARKRTSTPLVAERTFRGSVRGGKRSLPLPSRKLGAWVDNCRRIQRLDIVRGTNVTVVVVPPREELWLTSPPT